MSFARYSLFLPPCTEYIFHVNRNSWPKKWFRPLSWNLKIDKIHISVFFSFSLAEVDAKHAIWKNSTGQKVKKSNSKKTMSSRENNYFGSS